jgi:DNA helicase-2/ATP-dependent DNA helicase PcrA
VPASDALQRCAAAVPSKAAADWAQWVTTLTQVGDPALRKDPSRAVRLVLEAGYADTLQTLYANARNRLEDLEQLAVFARQFQSIEEFLAQLALLTNLDADEDRPEHRDEEELRLSSIHQAKGLEFDVVFVIHLCEGLFPSTRSIEADPDTEEERRLFYVAVTRARNELYLSYPLMRSSPGPGGDWMQHPSRFLAEVPVELHEEWNLKGFD